MQTEDRDYYRHRAERELALARESAIPEVMTAHLKMCETYRGLARAANEGHHTLKSI